MTSTEPAPPFGPGSLPEIQANKVKGSEDDRLIQGKRAREVRQNILFHDQLKAVITQLCQQMDMNVAFDQSFPDKRVDVQFRNVTKAEALDLIMLSNGLFFQPVGANGLIVAQDNQANRNRLQDMCVQTFYLKNADLKEVQQDLTALFGQRVTTLPNQDLRALIVRTAPENMKLVTDVVETIDKEKPGVIIDISIYEVTRSDLLEFGNQLMYDGFLGSSAQGSIVPGSLNTLGATAGQLITEQRLALAIPTSILRMLQTKSRSNLADSVQLHALDGQRVQANIGQSIPIQTSSYIPYAQYPISTSSGTSQTPQPTAGNALGYGIPQVEYRDVGLNVTVTPTVYSDEDVRLEMGVETSGYAKGPSDLTPIITKRSLKSVATVRTGQAAMMAGVAQKRDDQGRTSIPLLGFLPVIGRFFSIPKQSSDTTDILITVTPHIIRAPSIGDSDRLARLSGTIQSQGITNTMVKYLQQAESNPVLTPSEVRTEGELPVTTESRSKPAGRDAEVPAEEDTEEAGTLAGRGVVRAPQATPAEAGEIRITLLASPDAPRAGEWVQVALYLNQSEEIRQASINLTFDPKILRPVRVADGGLMSTTEALAEVERRTGISGSVGVTLRVPNEKPARPARGRLALVLFDVLSAGRVELSVDASTSRFLTQSGKQAGCSAVPLILVPK
ncbi:MAG: hypothetical protein HY650_09725 [Acidobacteria bacterium]|nr:hypothetical protein [Acidobacteriota bacterium]